MIWRMKTLRPLFDAYITHQIWRFSIHNFDNMNIYHAQKSSESRETTTGVNGVSTYQYDEVEWIDHILYNLMCHTNIHMQHNYEMNQNAETTQSLRIELNAVIIGQHVHKFINDNRNTSSLSSIQCISPIDRSFDS